MVICQPTWISLKPTKNPLLLTRFVSLGQIQFLLFADFKRLQATLIEFSSYKEFDWRTPLDCEFLGLISPVRLVTGCHLDWEEKSGQKDMKSIRLIQQLDVI